MKKHTIVHRLRTRAISLVAIVSIAIPSIAIAEPAHDSYEKDFTLTAYYSPVADQCCYVTGGLESDKVLNGNGTKGADGTAVYAGMIAAPKSYAYGTRITVPGLGTLTVHDRGGAITEQDRSDRLDVWMGYGEEGLARALAFGVKHVRGTVYAASAAKPSERFDLASVPAPFSKLKPFFLADVGLLGIKAKAGDHSLSVMMLQESLRDAGVFTGPTSGVFGRDTQAALTRFNRDYGIGGNGSSLTETSAAYLTVASTMKKAAMPVALISKSSAATDIESAKRLLRFLGYYKGRTDGHYSDALFSAILKYQQSRGLVGDATSPGAGRIGPLTQKKLTTDHTRKIVALNAKKLLLLKQIGDSLETKGKLPNTFLSVGKNGKGVRAVQEFLAAQGFFPKEKVNGNFGTLTQSSVAAYQLARGLIKDSNDLGAGTVGPATLTKLRSEQIHAMYSLVRAEGMQVL